MQQMLEMVLDILRGAWRFRWVGVSAAWVICILGWVAVMMLPDTFEATARVYVDMRTTLGQVTQGIGVDTPVDSQIARVKQALLSGPQLTQVAEDVYPNFAAKTAQEKQRTIGALRDRIVVTSTTQGSSDKPTGGTYVISYQDHNRDRALRVVSQLVNTFTEGTLGGKRQGTEQAQQFLVDQIKDYEQRLSLAESRRADFKRKNVGLMPGAQGGYFTRLQTEMESVDKAQGLLTIAERRRDELQRQLRGETPILPSNAPLPSAAGSRPATTRGNGDDAPSGVDTASRIRDTQARLDELLLRFTEKYPDVIALRNTLAELQERQKKEIEAFRKGDPAAAAGIGLAANPVFQSIQLELNKAEVEIASLRGEISSHRSSISELRKLLDTAPNVEAEFAKLDRDYDVTNAQYKALVERLERARLSEQADETGVVRFDTVDPPSASFKPVSPPRSLLILGILCGGMGAGAGLAYLLHLLRPIFFSAHQLTAITGLPVLGIVSSTSIDRHVRQMRLGLLGVGAAAGLLLAVGAGLLMAQDRILPLLQHASI